MYLLINVCLSIVEKVGENTTLTHSNDSEVQILAIRVFNWDSDER